MSKNNLVFSLIGNKESKSGQKIPSNKTLSSKIQSQLNKKERQSQKDIDSETTAANKKKPAIVSEIQKLTKKLEESKQQIEETEKKLDVDLFLKQQKEKKQQYAKDLNKEYEIQKKKRQEKLYKKYREKQPEEAKQTANVKSSVPMQLFKILQTEKKTISKSQQIFSGHHLSLDDLLSNERQRVLLDHETISREEKELLFTDSDYTCTQIKKIAENSLDIIYFPIKNDKGQLQPTENYQSLMNSLVLMPEDLVMRNYSHKTVDQSEIFLGKMFYNGVRKTVLTGDLVETKELAHRWINVQSRISGNSKFGPTLIEKMFRKVSSNKTCLDLKSCIYTLFGLDAEVVPISNKNYLKQNFTDIVKFLKESGQVVGFINDNHSDKIYQNRVYPLNEVQEVIQQSPEEAKMSKKKKKKPQQEAPSAVEKEPKVQRVYVLQDPWKGLSLDSKGINKFELLELFEMFNKMVLVREFPKSWVCKRINLQLFSTDPLSITSNQWTKNNQYSFTVTSSRPTNVRFVMRKQHSSESEAIVRKNQEVDESGQLYGFLLFEAKEGENKISCMKMENLLVKTKSSDGNGAAFNHQFQGKGTYIIIPYSNKVTKNSYQFFNLDFYVEREDSIVFGKAVINEWRWVPKNQSSQKVIQSLESKEVIQKPKIEEVPMNRVSNHGLSLEKLLKNITTEHLVFPKDMKATDIIIPGKLTRFLINPEIEQKVNSHKGKGTSKKSVSDQRNPQKFNHELQNYQKEEALSILLGYDVLQSEDIDRGQMMTEAEQNQDVIDLAHYGLGKEGLTATMETLMSHPVIRKLDLSHNDLDDSSVVFLCYYLDKGNRIELREIDLSHNSFGKVGKKALQGLIIKYKQLHIAY